MLSAWCQSGSDSCQNRPPGTCIEAGESTSTAMACQAYLPVSSFQTQWPRRRCISSWWHVCLSTQCVTGHSVITTIRFQQRCWSSQRHLHVHMQLVTVSSSQVFAFAVRSQGSSAVNTHSCSRHHHRQVLTLTVKPRGSSAVTGAECSMTLPPVKSPCMMSTPCR